MNPSAGQDPGSGFDTDDQTSVHGRFGYRFALTRRPGEPGRPPLLLCSGIGSPHALFDPLVAELAPDRPLVRFDPPGVGASPPSRWPYRYGVLARLLADALRELGHERFDVLGISWGGGLAQQLAFQYPGRCRRVVLVATGTGTLMVPARPRVLGRMLTPRRHRDPGYAVRFAGELYGGRARVDPEAAMSALHRAPVPTTAKGYLHQLAAIAGWSSLPFLPLIRQPTLVLAGDDDPIIPPANSAILGALLPRAVVHRYSGGHLHLLTDPEDLAPVIDAFLGSESAIEKDPRERPCRPC
ncbi:alpha/beta fold hydrolase [Actinomycetospora endophytica]|uniref:Alpha/beta fold hydrolase n=1 Tax=Actinomycetospora endophytica TaxID=2291215 RepID=A0ABS8PIZ1_9PSEU|nr:alpha/beta fold hydrolase [Actinomycetospora endophytica]MCD2198192.1 alpha/beta fold hydrolase [Actinomycetospora endophytica]